MGIWYKRFLGRRDAVVDDQRSGRLISSSTLVIIKKVQNVVEEDHCGSPRMIEDSLNTNEEMIRTIMHKALRYKNVF
ncbi:hypothetical protein TNCV_1270711 [Trichonephila clavipes]|nr:hypothetical protein TNCV_1270711 [Trichonephila clavipes]